MRRAVRIGHYISAVLFFGSLLCLLLAGKLEIFDHSLPLPGDFRVGLLKWPRNLDGYKDIYSSAIIVFNGESPYLGSVYHTDDSVREIDYRDWGIYYRKFYVDREDYWLTCAVSLWWFVLASVVIPVFGLLWHRRLQFSIRMALLFLAIEAVLIAFVPIAAASYPISLLVNAALAIATILFLRVLFAGMRSEQQAS